MALQKVKTTGTGGKGRWCTREEAKSASKKHRRAQDKKTQRPESD